MLSLIYSKIVRINKLSQVWFFVVAKNRKEKTHSIFLKPVYWIQRD